ncbi:unnamed protein product [Peronospora belbahrii]|uniref:PUB domain-containing protein n=1 Tax=Peronospora belbahrii TaxID=622444 RepID=A0AAU9L4D5_9STRA|nr:unnamed protein product [Peronospora belbahrii]
MSEFRQAIDHVEALEACLTLLQQLVTNCCDRQLLEEKLSFIMTAINGEIDVIMSKFRARCSMVDPVTKQARFGPKMLAKVQDLLQRYDDITLRMKEDAPLRLDIEEKIHKIAEEEAAKESDEVARKRETRIAQQAEELARKQEQQRQQQAALELKAEHQRVEQLRIEALASAAQEKRERREKERAKEEQQRMLEEQERERLNALIPHGKQGLEKAMTMLKESTGEEALFRQSLVKLLGVVSNICSAPENAAFRHIPKYNANFHADLGQYAGGHQCLLALGFKELQQGDEAQPRAVFVLEEPNLSEDFNAWSNWFDELKEMQCLVESKL